jgi:hypothetical protein
MLLYVVFFFTLRVRHIEIEYHFFVYVLQSKSLVTKFAKTAILGPPLAVDRSVFM